MRRYIFLPALVLLLAAGALQAQVQGNNPLIPVYENGVGSLNFPGGNPIPLRCVPTSDPGPGGLSNALTCNLLGPPSLVAGDLMLQETVGGPLSDIIRFNPAGTGPGYPASLVFYSDTGDELPAPLADTGLPTAFYANTFTALETTLPGGLSGIIYTPTATQPGFVPGFSVTYQIVSDVPEPATVSLFLVAGGVLLMGSRLRHARTK
jgi:hypothetical protein